MPFGASSVKRTVWSSTLVVPLFDSTPFRAESALEPLAGSARRSMEATTSSAVITRPSWNLTPSRSLNVQTLPSLLGSHDRASIGRSLRSGPS